MIKFEKISEGKYRADITEDINNKIDTMLGELSQGETDAYLDVNNDMIKRSMISRLIASYFFKDKELEYNKVGFATILVNNLGYNLTVSVGLLTVVENGNVKRVTGSLYNQ